MADEITIRPTHAHDLAAVDALLAASYPSILKRDYAPSVLVTALPIISRANPALLRSGSYYMAEDGDGRALAAGGWSRGAPQGGAGRPEIGHVRHVATHPAHLRKGLAQAILTRVLAEALAAGVERMVCQSTLTAVPLYTAMGFRTRGEIAVRLAPGITFPAVEMERLL
ncbi:GNAT family N-acetyltransferase [Roseicyclus persicicus]|uniref:GNAT family N-acetyltransferase n=1 Tax=Roseicyclus persicicus TaxID=2650661 RepID=A0A7X6JX40_9RHOB|nr:GNAT family N-acetyltransferase [Roseibacterium persicicum]NKX44385.1 GNAT family N-acetyltransferase [Roseibacterium persicicum]